MDFDSTLGFPGEGPHSQVGRWTLLRWTLLAMACVGVDAVGRCHGDQARRELRAGVVLPEGRRVTARTSSVRSQLMSAFNVWLRDAGLSFEDMLLASPPNLD